MSGSTVIILIPISRPDAPHGVPLAEHIVKLGGVNRHDVVLFYAGQESEAVAQEMKTILTKFTSTVRCVDSGVQDDRPWPQAANSMFKAACKWIDKSGYTGPWFWFELDCVPLVSNWADALQDEYLRAGKPFLGVKQENIWRKPDGTVFVDGFHMAGTALYPAPITPWSRLWKWANTTAFDVFIMNEVVPNMADTQLIQHNWCTANYRRQGNKIVCECSPGKQDLGLPKPLRPDAVVLHGCKDFSLLELFGESVKEDK